MLTGLTDGLVAQANTTVVRKAQFQNWDFQPIFECKSCLQNIFICSCIYYFYVLWSNEWWYNFKPVILIGSVPEIKLLSHIQAFCLCAYICSYVDVNYAGSVQLKWGIIVRCVYVCVQVCVCVCVCVCGGGGGGGEWGVRAFALLRKYAYSSDISSIWCSNLKKI